MPKTKEEQREYQRAYYQANKEKAKEYQRAYYQANKDYFEGWRNKNIEYIKEQRKKYTKENRERINTLAKAQRERAFAKDPDKIRAKRKEAKRRLKKRTLRSILNRCENGVRKAGKKRSSEINDSYVAYLLSVQTGSRLYPTDIPKELIEAKRLQLLIRRELDEKRK
jgi:hypothetical protein